MLIGYAVHVQALDGESWAWQGMVTKKKESTDGGGFENAGRRGVLR